MKLRQVKKMRQTRLYLSALFLLLAAWENILYAQDEKKFQLYTAADGLSDNNITGIAQDAYGYLWLSTLRGLNRYDGKRFVQFHDWSKNNSLPDENLTRLIRLDKDHLAAYTGMGLHIINTLTGKTNDIIIPSPDPKYQDKFNIVMSALSDQQGNIYILTRSGFYHFDSQYTLVFRFDYYTKKEIETETFVFGSGMYWLADGEILMQAIDGFYRYTIQGRQMQKIKDNHPVLPALAAERPSKIYFFWQTDPGNLVYIKEGTDTIVYIDLKLKKKLVCATRIQTLSEEFNWRSRLFKVNDSLYYFTGRRSGFFKLHVDPYNDKLRIEPRRYFPEYVCTDFLIGSDDRLWIATNSGLFKEMNNSTSVRQIPIPSSLLKQSPDMYIRQVLCYKDKIYAGCAGNGGLLVYDKNTLDFLYKINFKKYHFDGENVLSVIQGRSDTLFIGIASSLIRLNTVTRETGIIELEGWDRRHDVVVNQFKDSRGNIWVCTNYNEKVYLLAAGAHRFARLNFHNEPLFQKILTPYFINEDKEGHIWMAGHGVCRINRDSGKPDLYLDSFPWIRFPRRAVTAIEFDKTNTLWAGVNNNGLTKYNIDEGTSLHFTANEGLPDNYIKAIFPLGNKFWIATGSGIASLDLQTHKISKFSREDGFLSFPVSTNSFFYDSSSHYLYCGFTNHIIRFYPDSLLYSESAPSLFIESVHFSNDTTYCYPRETIKVPYYKSDLTVSVGSINYNDVSNQRIAYRIAGSEDVSWQLLSGNHINFNNLPPGSYRLQVKLYAANNRWDEHTKEINIVITPPFWKTPWFFMLMSLVASSIIYIIYSIKVNLVRKTERAKVQVQQLKAEEYKNRLELEKISNYFSSSFSAKRNIDEVLSDVANNLSRWMGYVDCMIYLWNEDKTKMVQRAGHGPKGTPEAIAKRGFDVLPGQGVIGYVMETKEPVLMPDTTKDKRYRPGEMFRFSEICVPIIHNGELIGIIDSEHPKVNYFKRRELKILITIAALVGNKIKQVESEQSLAVKRYELATINEQLAEAQLIALQAQMNPHFIFNALNSIKRIILDNETSNASKYLSTFADMIRLTLNHSKTTFVTLQETIEYLHAYLDMEQLRIGSSFSYKIETSGETGEKDISIPTLMIQPLVENAIWHGLMHKAGKKKISIKFMKNDDMVTCFIKDNGIGIRQSEKMKPSGNRPHVGLENLRNRIKIMNEKYELNCRLEITDISEKDKYQTGTLVLLQFKVIPKKSVYESYNSG